MQNRRIVLLLEDDAALMRAMKRHLSVIQKGMEVSGRGFEVMEATTVAAAKELLRTLNEQDQVCVLSDGDLSDGNGVAFVEHCRVELGSRLLDGRVCTGDITNRIQQLATAARVPVEQKPYLLMQEYAPILKAAFRA